MVSTVTLFNVFNADLRVLYFVVDVADYSDVSIPAFIRQRCSLHLGRQLLNGDSGSIVETRLGQTDLQPGVRPQRFIDDIPTAQQQAQQTTGGRHLVVEQRCPLLANCSGTCETAVGDCQSNFLVCPTSWFGNFKITPRDTAVLHYRLDSRAYSLNVYSWATLLSLCAYNGKTKLEIFVGVKLSTSLSPAVLAG